MRFSRHGILAGLAVVAAVSVNAAPSGSYADWRTQVWASQPALDDAVSGPAADPDGDGLANFAEYALGRDPTVPDPPGTLRWVADTNSPSLVLRQQLSRSATESAAVAAWAEDLVGGVWLPPDGTNLLEQVTDSGASLREYLLTLRPGTHGLRFARVLAQPTPPTPTPPAWVWFEAEPPGTETNAALSGNAMCWLSAGQKFARDLQVPADGDYQLWVRKFVNPQSFRWRAGPGASWIPVGGVASSALTDLVALGTNTARQVGWIQAGTAALSAGSQTFEFEVITNQASITAYDCFVLTRAPFQPRGKLKPDERSGAAQPGWFAFEPEADPLIYSPIDLRRLNESSAGAGGMIGTNDTGFVHAATGEPVRFWGVNLGPELAARPPDEIDLLARGLAKRGVNLVRYRGPVCVTSGANLGALDPDAVAHLQYLVAALKREGIYVSLSLYDPRWLTLSPVNTAFPGYTNQAPYGLVYFNTNFQALYRGVWSQLLAATNLHTGLALREDPAVAFLELVNEDSLLASTFDPASGAAGNVPDAQRALLEQQFAAWLTSRYAPLSLQSLRLQAWGGLSSPQDQPAAGRMGLRSTWDIATQRTPRDQDTAEFLTSLMGKFYSNTAAYLRTNCGYRGLLSAASGQTANPPYLDPLNTTANVQGGFLRRHGAFTAYHVGTDAANSVRAGQVYNDRAATTFEPQAGTAPEFANPIFDLGYTGMASSLSELSWPRPNRYRAEMTFLTACYGCLQGLDAVDWFTSRSIAWDIAPGRDPVQTPAGLGQFPATALLYRLGLVQTGPPVVDLEVSLEDLQDLKGIPVPTALDFAALRGTNAPGGTLTNVVGIDSLAFLVGRVGIRVTTNAGPQSTMLDLGPYVDRTNRVVTSGTGELRWDYGRGCVSLNAPAAQGATGFLGAVGQVECTDMTLELPLEYGAVLVVSLDGQPLPSASRLLVQVMSEEQPYGWQTSTPTGPRTILNAGQSPWMVRNLAGRIEFKWPDASTLLITPLDANGYRLPGSERTGPTLELLPDRFYYLVERNNPGTNRAP